MSAKPRAEAELAASRALTARPPPGIGQLSDLGDGRVTLSASTYVLTLMVVLLLVLPWVTFATIAPGADLVLEAGATTTAGIVAALAWIRFREAGRAHELFQASALLVLACGGVVALGVAMTGIGQVRVSGPLSPSQVPFYIWDIARLIAGFLFVIGGWASASGTRGTVTRPLAVLIAPAALFALLVAVVLGSADRLPELRDQEQMGGLVGGTPVMELAQLDPVVATVEVLIACLFVLAAILYRRAHLMLGQRALVFLVLGLIMAAAAQFHWVFVPTTSGLVTSVDFFRVTFYGILLTGVAIGARDDLRSLSLADHEVRALRDADVRAATLQERARLAREMHDGLIQELWLTRLKAGHLREVADLPADGRALADEVDTALDAALAEARLAVESLTSAPDGPASLPGALERLVEDLRERLEPDLRLDIEPDLPAVSHEATLEILRIVREAVMNAGKHADPTDIEVAVSAPGGRLRIEVADNGMGFDTRARLPGFGLRSMRDRAALIGASLDISSQPHDGTRIVVELALPEAARGRRGVR